MTNTRYTASQLDIFVEGTPIEEPVMNSVVEVVVDQHTHLPNMFRIRLYDQTLELIDGDLFSFGQTVEIAGINKNGDYITLIKGEVTAVEPTFGEGMIAELVVQGYDKSHRLYREVNTESYFNVKDSDLAERFAGRAGLTPEVDRTTIVYDHIFQNNQSDLSFLTQRAWRIGYECFVDDQKLYFRKPVNGGGIKRTLEWGQDLISFRPRATLAEQVDEVFVHGWDPRAQSAIIGRAQNGKLYPDAPISRQVRSAKKFGRGKKVLVNQPVVSQAEADILAKARIDELSGSYLEAEGEAFRRPDVRAGQMVQLDGLGRKYSGTYMVTSATHVFSSAGLRVFFKVNGSRLGTLAEQMSHREPLDRWPGVVIGKVTNNDDPANLGRIKVTFPWMSKDAESFWARLAGPGAGPNAGFITVPDVGDEVLVAFELGDFSRPIVLGGLWSANKKNPQETKKPGEKGKKHLVRSWRSIKGHWISMHDDDKNKIHAETADNRVVTIDDADKFVEVAGHTNILGRKRSVKIDDKFRKITVTGVLGHNLAIDDVLGTIAFTSVSQLLGYIMDDTMQLLTIGWGVPQVMRNHSITLTKDGILIESDKEIVIKSGDDLILQSASDVTIRGKNIKLEKYMPHHAAVGKATSLLADAAAGKQIARGVADSLASGKQPLHHLNPNQN